MFSQQCTNKNVLQLVLQIKEFITLRTAIGLLANNKI
jgi:hypothetical protein